MAEVAYRALEEMIVTRRLRPASMISENQLSEQLGCGRTPIREALQRLKFEGFVEIHPRRGVLVTPIDVVRQLELLEVRRPLENLVVRLAAMDAALKASSSSGVYEARDLLVASYPDLGGDRDLISKMTRANDLIHVGQEGDS